jgi:hypothetical protein
MPPENIWECLLVKAFKQLDAANLSGASWTLGGGTVLMLHFSHRMSKDIDIFFSDKQLLAMVSPRINDGTEDFLKDYIEQDGFCKLLFKEGKIDFIYSRQISDHTPQTRMLVGRLVQCEDPVEIAAKKIFWRNDRFTPRDIFDLAVVFNAKRQHLVETLLKYPDKVASLAEQIASETAPSAYDTWAATAPILPAGEPFVDNALRDVSILIETVTCQSKTKEQKHEAPSLDVKHHRKARMR